MKIIEALKKREDLKRKADDLRALVRDNCALSSFDTPKYADQKKQVREWIQAHSDVLTEIERLTLAIQRTNLKTIVTIELGTKVVEKPIAAWILRRRDLAKLELAMWNQLSDRNIKEGFANGPSGDPIEIKLARFYDPQERDTRRELYASEPSVIDARLEVVNATTDLIE